MGTAVKWFKHDSDAGNDSKLKKLKSKFGLAGYGLYFHTLELMSRKLESDLEHVGFLPEEWDMESLEIEFGASHDTIGTMYDYMIKIGLFQKNDGRLYNDKLKDRCDEYTTRIIKKSVHNENQRLISRQSPDTIGTKTDFVALRIDKNRIDKNIKETNTNVLVKKKSAIDDLTQKDFEDIADDYQTTIPHVLSCLDDLKNYCDRTGKTYKDYKAALRNFVKKDAFERRGHVQSISKISFVGDSL